MSAIYCFGSIDAHMSFPSGVLLIRRFRFMGDRLSNVVCTPHIGGSTEEAGERVLAEVCSAVIDTLNGTLPPGRIVNGNPDKSLRLARVESGLF